MIHPLFNQWGEAVEHDPAVTCGFCDETVDACLACFHSVEDDAHADGCDQCACPLHLTIGD